MIMFARFRSTAGTFALTLAVIFCCAVYAAELRVAPSGAPYTSIQDAIDAASDNDTILIAAGTYSDIHARLVPDGYLGPATINQVVYIDKKIGLHGGYDPTFTTSDPETYPTVIDALHQARGIVVAPETDPVISGLIIRNGYALSQGGAILGDAGGGLFSMSSSPIILSCVFDSCSADCGGGLYLDSCDYFNLLQTVISNSYSSDYGGGAHILASDGYINNCTFENNFCDGIGGGAYIAYNRPSIDQSRFLSNTARQSGGGLALAYSGAHLTDCLIKENNAKNGAGIRCYSTTGKLERNNIQRNAAEYDAGGVYLEGCTLTMVNNFICWNGLRDPHGNPSGMLIDGGSVTLIHNTVSRNTGGDRCGITITDIMADPASVSITNQITSTQETGVFVDAGSTLTMNTTHWHDNTTNWTGPGSIDSGSATFFGDPMFINPGTGDFHLQTLSPAINKAATTSVPVDIDGHVRPWNGGSDIGADEQRVIPLLGVWINMPQFVSPGEKFFIHGYLENSGSALNDISVFFILDVFGDYWFWPAWTHFNPATSSGIDFETRMVDSGQTRIYVMNPFVWPDTGSTTLNNLAIWGAMLDPLTSTLIGDYGFVSWSFGP